MSKIRYFINKLSNFQKFTCIIFMLVFVLLSLLSNSTPTLADPTASINVGGSLWNDLRYELNEANTVYSNSSITFSIENIGLEKSYYISNSNIALTQAEIDSLEPSSWIPYSLPVEISDEGSYVVYVKLVDGEVITYLNTDLLIIDKSSPTLDVSVDNNSWNDLRDTLDHVYINVQTPVTVEVNDDTPSGISSIKYYITDEILSTTDLNELNSENWITYSTPISISEIGTHIVYVQAIDNALNTTYINTDYIVLNGYTETFTVGRNLNSYIDADPYITNKSVVTLNFSYSNSSNELTDHTHNLMSNMLLPINTKITLIDHIKERVYQYKITTEEDIYGYNASCDPEDLDCVKVATYPLTLFKEVGNVNDIFFVESTYYTDGTVNENFSVVLDLSNTNILENHNNASLYMELRDSENIVVRPTLYNSIKKFNIYSSVGSEDANTSLYLSTDYTGNTIEFNSDSSTDININSKINYKIDGESKIIDTTYEDKEVGISIKLVDSEGNIVDKEHLKNIVFKVGNGVYYPEEDNIVRINLNSGIADVIKTLTIITFQNNGILEEGTYYFKISNYASYDGHYYDELSNELSIPVNVTDNNSNIEYSFGVIMNDANRIINKNDTEVSVSFNILQNGELEDPNIRVSLYKKEQLTAYNQNYIIVDLADYVSNELSWYEGNVYFVSANPVEYVEPDYLYNNFQLNLITDNFDNTGYKFVFDLYDGTKKIGTIEKYFIIK